MRNVIISRPSSGDAVLESAILSFFVLSFRQNEKISFSRLFVLPKRQP